VTSIAHDRGNAQHLNDVLSLSLVVPTMLNASSELAASSRLSNEILEEFIAYLSSDDKQRLRAVSAIFLRAALRARYERVAILPGRQIRVPTEMIRLR
jgi:hypothetical protein